MKNGGPEMAPISPHTRGRPGRAGRSCIYAYCLRFYLRLLPIRLLRPTPTTPSALCRHVAEQGAHAVEVGEGGVAAKHADLAAAGQDAGRHRLAELGRLRRGAAEAAGARHRQLQRQAALARRARPLEVAREIEVLHGV